MSTTTLTATAPHPRIVIAPFNGLLWLLGGIAVLSPVFADEY
jgi:hypothetical protein